MKSAVAIGDVALVFLSATAEAEKVTVDHLMKVRSIMDPLLVYCHGGPGGGVTYGLFPQFMQTVGQVDPYPTEAMASVGFAVLFPMPRGAAGYGEAGQRAIVNAWGESDYKDIMAGVDDLVAKGVADPDRLGVMGASYGGFMTDCHSPLNFAKNVTTPLLIQHGERDLRVPIANAWKFYRALKKHPATLRRRRAVSSVG
jgi:dipeptidyl aminopeptidase/acylaminoacyl peptidase